MTDRGRSHAGAPLVLRSPKLMWLVAGGLVVNGLANAGRLGGFTVPVVALGAGWLVVLARLRTVASDDALEVRTVRGTRRLLWPEVAAVRPGRGGVVAVTRGGEEVPLPNVEWRPVVPSDPAYVYPRSGQAVADRARAAGHDVALEP